MEKKEIRKQIREIKKQYTLEDKKRMSASVWQQVEHNEVFQRSEVVLVEPPGRLKSAAFQQRVGDADGGGRLELHLHAGSVRPRCKRIWRC